MSSETVLQSADVNVEKLPTNPAEITREWLGSKLERGEIVKLELESAIWGTGSKLFYTVTYASPGVKDPKHICVKGVFDPAMVQAQPWTVSLAQREAEFFGRIVPLLQGINIRYPKGYWSGVGEGQGICVMEDLRESRCSFAPEVANYRVQVVMDGVEQLAGLHGRFWGKGQEDEGYEWIWNNYDPAMSFMVSVWDEVVRQPGRTKLPEWLMDGEKANRAVKKYLEGRNPRFRTLLHGDTHIGNVYFTEEGKLGFLDWSAFHFGSCFHDLVYFMTALLTVEDRRMYEMEILDRYLDKLAECGGPRFDRRDEEVMKEYQRSFMTNVVWFICPFELQSMNRVAMLCERTLATWEDHGVLEKVLAE